MLLTKSPQQLKRLRRLALAAQGLVKPQSFGRGLTATKQAINHLGYVQLDTISVVERAHHHVLYSRVPGFKPPMLAALMSAGDIFEYWSHAAAVLPMADFRYSLPYKQAIKRGQVHWYKNPDLKLMQQLVDRIRSDGPLRSRDVEINPKQQAKGAGWWEWKPAKKALEQLYMQGDLMVSQRLGFQKTYDLTERVLPAEVNTSMPSTAELAAHLLNQQLRCHQLVSLPGLTYLRRNPELKQAMKSLVNERLAEGSLRSIQLPNDAVYLIKPEALNQPLPRRNQRVVILSPFDNSVIQRDRLKALFGFDYQIECYVPAAKRRYGYFSLPLLYRDVFVGRMDCKAHRKDRHLEIKSLHLEADQVNHQAFDIEAFNQAFRTALIGFREFQQCDTLCLKHVSPKYLAQPLNKVLRTELKCEDG